MREAEGEGWEGKKTGGKSGEKKWGVGYVNGWAARLVRKMPFHSRHSTLTQRMYHRDSVRRGGERTGDERAGPVCHSAATMQKLRGEEE